jgi:hypothetical protein
MATTLSSEALLSKKITKNVRKRAKIAKNAQSRRKETKIGPRGSFERGLIVFRPYKNKKGSKDTIVYHFTLFLLFPWPKKGTPLTLSSRISRKSLLFRPLYRELWVRLANVPTPAVLPKSMYASQ